ncbi:DUF1707 domain-containing protein [Amycolatopsis sp. NPDC021455]|uniref:DUF1707 domain-containing protein n=1 Tax=Amycolatopsis sp. NPDC021455 TaxID=3154901 RepID=UPI0033D485F0
MAGRAPRADVRIGHEARAEATGKLDKALREGRIDLAEYERRVVVVQAARVRKDLTPAIADLPARISAADRERALVLLADALTDGRLSASAYADAEVLLNRAVTYADVDAVVGNLDAKASHAERDQAIARIEAAVAGGLLDPAERHDRVAAVRRAATDAQLEALVADLPAGAGPARSPRASHADREAVVAQLHDAVEAGLLELPEFDERVRAVYAARLRDELARVVADLPSPGPRAPLTSLPPAPPIDLPPRKPSFRAGMTAAVVAAVGMVPMVGIVIVLGMLGFTAPAIVVGSVWAVVFVALVVWARRTTTAAIAEIDAPPPVDLFRPVVEPVPAEPAPVARRKKTPPRKRLLGEHEGGLASVTALVLPGGTPVAISGGCDNTAKVWDLTDDSLRHTLSGHTHDVRGVSAMVLPDGVPVAVTVSADRTARVWDLRDGSQRGVPLKLADHGCAVWCLRLADGTPVAVTHAGIDKIQTWDLRDNKRLHDVSYDSTFEKAVPVVLPDGTPVVLTSDWDGNITAVHLKSGKTRFRLTGHTERVSSIDTAVLPDGTPVAVSASTDKTVRVWDLRRRTLVHTIAGMVHAKEAVVCTSLADGTPVVVASDLEENTMAWDLRDGAVLPYRRALRGGTLGALALPDHTLIVGLADDYSSLGVQRLALEPDRGPAPVKVKPAKVKPVARGAKAPIKRVQGEHKGGLLAMTGLVLPDGSPVAITGGRDNTAKVWGLSDGSLRYTLRGHTNDVVGVAAMVLPDGVPVAVTVSEDRTARVWDLTDGSLRGSPVKCGRGPQGVRCLSLADGTPVAVIHNTAEAIEMWDLRDGKQLGKIAFASLDDFFDMVHPVVLPEGTQLALATDWDGLIKVLNLKDGKTKGKLRGHTHPIRAIDTTVLPDGTPIAVSVSGDKTARVWDLRSGTSLHTITGMTHTKEAVVCTSLPDGTPVAVAVGYENTAMWDLRDGSELPCPLALEADLLGAVALPDRTLILCLTADAWGLAVHPLS